ncbi:MAG TPA: four helix bundle protein [Chthoniobacterales bacterium]|nr:four helix bundle protein [Chthoniobacterales bacterium]
MDKKTRSCKDVLVWQQSIALAQIVYQLTKSFPSEEKFGLIAQMRRAAVSIPSNIAEGQGRHTTGEFIQFISRAEGSVAEVDSQLILSIELNLCSQAAAEPAFALIADLRRTLNALRRNLAAPT